MKNFDLIIEKIKNEGSIRIWGQKTLLRKVTVNSGLVFGGMQTNIFALRKGHFIYTGTPVEIYDGSSWSVPCNLNTLRSELAGSGFLVAKTGRSQSEKPNISATPKTETYYNGSLWLGAEDVSESLKDPIGTIKLIKR